MAYTANKSLKEAEKRFQEALKLNPAYKDAQSALDKFPKKPEKSSQ
jgi:hypothetical protein